MLTSGDLPIKRLLDSEGIASPHDAEKFQGSREGAKFRNVSSSLRGFA